MQPFFNSSVIVFPLNLSSSSNDVMCGLATTINPDRDKDNQLLPNYHTSFLIYKLPGVTVTQAWTTAALLDTKIEWNDIMSQPLKAEFQNLFHPNNPQKAAQKLNFTFRQPNLHARAFLDRGAAGNVSAVLDAVIGHEGFVVGAEAGYDVQKAAVTRYSAAVGYQTATYSATVTGTQNLRIVAASYYQKVNANVEAGAKATYDLQGNNSVALEVASKYRIDPISFAKVCALFYFHYHKSI